MVAMHVVSLTILYSYKAINKVKRIIIHVVSSTRCIIHSCMGSPFTFRISCNIIYKIILYIIIKYYKVKYNVNIDVTYNNNFNCIFYGNPLWETVFR